MQSFLPIPELRLDDAQIALFFLSAKGIFFVDPVDDVWFSAHKPFVAARSIPGPNTTDTFYVADKTANVLGCVMRHQMCNPNTHQCSPLALEQIPDPMWSTREQEQIFRYWWASVGIANIDLSTVIRALHVSGLQARDGFLDQVQAHLPSDQWQQEALHWETISMALLQRLTVELATGPSDKSITKCVMNKRPKLSKDQSCLPQKIRSNAYTSFSVLGLAITLLAGSVIIILSHIVEPLYGVLQRRRGKAICHYRHLEWVTNETLQLQRMVHEELGLGTWTETASSIPVTEKDEKLAVLDVSDETHPILVPSSSHSSAEKPGGGPDRDENRSFNEKPLPPTPDDVDISGSTPLLNTGSRNRSSRLKTRVRDISGNTDPSKIFSFTRQPRRPARTRPNLGYSFCPSP